MGQLCILCSLGDEKIEWDPDDQESIDKAEEKFNQLLKKGWKAYRVSGDGKKGKEITTFPPYAARVLMIPKVVGG